VTETDPAETETQTATEEPTTAPAEDGAPVDPETFTREYVQKLRDEAAGHRVKAKRADALAARLVTAQAALTGRLADPTDLPFTEDLLDDDGLVDETKVRAAVDDLINRKPHLAARRPTGDVGLGARAETSEMGLAALLRSGT
jgi:hypothetical protein